MGNKHAIPRAPEPDDEPSLKLRLEDRLGILDPIMIFPYNSFGTEDGLHLRGRVVEQRELKGTSEESSTWRNVIDMIQRLQSDEIPGARLRAEFRGQSWETRTDKEGFFVFDVDLTEPIEPGWHDVRIELLESVGEPEARVVVEHVLVPSPYADFAVVSDIDDTIVETKNTDFMRQMAIIFGKGAAQRVPFPGVPAFYRALRRGPSGDGDNPIFYISRTGWNLYDLFDEFMEIHDIPRGPLFLSDLRVIEDKSRVLGSDEHKYENTDLLLRTYPELPFILIGDSGMHDPELYLGIVRAHPGRIKAIYIHDVSADKRDREVDAIARQLRKEHGVPLVHGETTATVTEHAAEAGFIDQLALEEVNREVISAGDSTGKVPAENRGR